MWKPVRTVQLASSSLQLGKSWHRLPVQVRPLHLSSAYLQLLPTHESWVLQYAANLPRGGHHRFARNTCVLEVSLNRCVGEAGNALAAESEHASKGNAAASPFPTTPISAMTLPGQDAHVTPAMTATPDNTTPSTGAPPLRHAYPNIAWLDAGISDYIGAESLLHTA